MLITKHNFLRRLVGEREKKLSSQIFHIFAERDVSELAIVEQCRYLEACYGTNCTGDISTSAESWGIIKKKILSADKDFRAKCCNNHQSLKHLSTIHSEISWLKIWDTALDHGVRGSMCFQYPLSATLWGQALPSL